MTMFVAGCSSSSPKNSAPAAARSTTTTLAGPTGFASGGPVNGFLARLAASLATCPKTANAAENVQLTQVNADITAPARELVPIKVLSVLLCAYSQDGSRRDVVLNGAAAAR